MTEIEKERDIVEFHGSVDDEVLKNATFPR